jgi:hypothetical protein
MREIRTSGSMRGGRKRAFARRACLLLYSALRSSVFESSNGRRSLHLCAGNGLLNPAPAMPFHAAWKRHELRCSPFSQVRTPLGVGSLVLLRGQVRPKSSEPYKLPDLSATAIDEPFAAMQPVSAIPSIHVGIPPSTATMDPSGLTGRR